MEGENFRARSESGCNDGEYAHLSLTQRLRSYAWQKLPAIFPDPNYREHLAINQRGDEKDNKESSPPDDEVVQLHSLTVAEIYAPPHAEKLLSSIRALGWHKDESLGNGGDPVAWIQRTRSASLGGAWLNLGSINRPGSRGGSTGLTRVAPLPKDVQHAFGKIYCLTPSITCILMTFLYEDSFALRYDESLRRTRQTYMEPTRMSYRVVEPFFQKVDEVRAIRNEARNDASDWFRTNLPGLFAGGLLNGQFPTCEFITLDKAEPFAASSEQYLRALKLSDDFGAWSSEEVPGLKFAQEGFDEEERFHAILATRRQDLETKDLQAWGEPGRRTYVAYLEEHLHGLLSQWALLAAIGGYESKLNAVRDTALFSLRPKKNAMKAMSTMSGLISTGADAATIAADLRQFASEGAWFERRIPKFLPANPEHYAPETTLARALHLEIEKRAAALQETDRSIRDLAMQQATMLSATENINLQNRLTLLTWVLVVLTVVITALTAVAAYDPLLAILRKYP